MVEILRDHKFDIDVYRAAIRLQRMQKVPLHAVHDAFCDYLGRRVYVPDVNYCARYVVLAARTMQSTERFKARQASLHLRESTHLGYEDMLIDALDSLAYAGRRMSSILAIRAEASRRAAVRKREAKAEYARRKRNGEDRVVEAVPRFRNDKWEADLAAVQHLISEGFSHKRIAEDLGVSNTQVRAWCAGGSIPTEKSGLAIRELARRYEAGEYIGLKNKHAHIDRAAVKRLWGERKSTLEISRLLGCSKMQVHRIQKALGLTLNVAVRRAIDKSRVHELHAQGFDVAKISELLGFRPGTVRSALRAGEP